jgi:hypothetical protein
VLNRYGPHLAGAVVVVDITYPVDWSSFDSLAGGEQLDVLLAGDDADAKAWVAEPVEAARPGSGRSRLARCGERASWRRSSSST